MKTVPDHRAGEPFERLLHQALEARSASTEPGQTCLDAETLAAWADDGLNAAARAAAEAHAADCQRCQALLAAMIRTAPPAPEVQAWWRLPAIRWLVPLTAAATAVMVWAIVPGRPRFEPGDRTLPAVNEPAPASTPEIATAPQPPRSEAPSSPAESRLDQPASGKAKAANENDALAKRDESSDAASRKSAADAPTPLAGASNAAPAPAPPPARAAAEAAEPAVTRAVPSAPRTEGAGGAVPQAPSPQASASAPAAVAQAPRSAVADAREAFRSGAGTEIVSPAPNTRWRITVRGAVERSVDGGSTWETQQTGAAVTLAAGSSPSPLVCWLVGPGGVVQLTTNGGRSWTRVAFPSQEDLVAVRATDGRSATITAVSGRTFTTTDLGVQWTLGP